MKLIHNIHLFFVTYFYRFLTFILPIFISKKSAKDGILFLENFPIENAGYQYRAKKWVDIFNNENLNAEVVTLFEDKNDFEQQFKNDDVTLFFIKSIRKRFQQCMYARKFKTVIVRRELLLYNDYGNLFMDKFLLKIHNNVILDFDDDIAAAKKQPKVITNFYGKLMCEDENKFNNSLRLYKRFVVASEYLKEKILKENINIKKSDVIVIPTCVDYDKYPAKTYNFDKEHIFTFGWIGGDHNYHLLQDIIPVLNNLSKDYKFKLLVIGGKKFEAKTNFEIDFRKWSLKTEIEDLMDIDVGLMPLKNNETSKGKGGFKLLQYMGLGIVGVAFNLTINKEIVTNYENSFLYSDNEELFLILSQILSNKFNLKNIGKKAKENIEKNYTFTANKVKYIDFIKNEDL